MAVRAAVGAAVAMVLATGTIVSAQLESTTWCYYCAYWGRDSDGTKIGRYCRDVEDGLGYTACESKEERCENPEEILGQCTRTVYKCTAPENEPPNCRRTPRGGPGGPGGPDDGDLFCSCDESSCYWDNPDVCQGEGGGQSETPPETCYRDVCDTETTSVDDYCEGSNYVCDTCESCWDEYDYDSGYSWPQCSYYDCNCRDEAYSYVCGSHEESYQTNCRSEPYVCGEGGPD